MWQDQRRGRATWPFGDPADVPAMATARSSLGIRHEKRELFAIGCASKG